MVFVLWLSEHSATWWLQSGSQCSWVCRGQQNSPTPRGPNPRNPVSPWPEYLGGDTSHEAAEVPAEGAARQAPMLSLKRVPQQPELASSCQGGSLVGSHRPESTSHSTHPTHLLSPPD